MNELETTTEPLWEWDPYPEEILGCRLKQTCGACPEQYDVFLEGQQIGYLRLRHGHFRVYYPDYMSDEIVYQASPDGDGVFEYNERSFYLTNAVEALLKRHTEKSST
jgi:hypothetical protein